tara:strand:- start:18 stop:734 length:717 start_codon:yes stop_codon:yes gene_type:complete
MILVFPQASHKFNLFYKDVRLSVYGLEEYAAKIANSYNHSNINGILIIILDSFAYQTELQSLFKNLFPQIPINFYVLKNETQGSMCSLLMAVNELKDLSVAVSSLDQILIDYPLALTLPEDQKVDIETPVFFSQSNSFSYILRDDDGRPIQAFEKKAVSSEAIMGVYKIHDFTTFFELSIELLEKYKGFRERVFFISDVINAYIRSSKIATFPNIESKQYYKFRSLAEFEATFNNEKN